MKKIKFEDKFEDKFEKKKKKTYHLLECFEAHDLKRNFSLFTLIIIFQ